MLKFQNHTCINLWHILTYILLPESPWCGLEEARDENSGITQPPHEVTQRRVMRDHPYGLYQDAA